MEAFLRFHVLFIDCFVDSKLLLYTIVRVRIDTSRRCSFITNCKKKNLPSVTSSLYIPHINEWFWLLWQCQRGWKSLQYLYLRYESVRYAGYHPDPPGGGIATAPAAPGRIRAVFTRVLVIRVYFNVRCLSTCLPVKCQNISRDRIS